MKSGHAWKLNPVVNGQPPEYPFTQITELPQGYTWDDILFIIGGYNWKARFVDKSNALGVDLGTGQLTYSSPAVLEVGSGEFSASGVGTRAAS